MTPLSPEAVEVQAPPIPEPPDNSRIEFTYNMRVYAFWSSSGAAEANGYLPKERWRGYGRNAAWGTWDEMVAAFGESLRSLVLLKPYFPPEPLELTPEEQAAKEKHPHMSTCHDQDCQECVREIAANRRTIKAVRPVIEADARADERLALGAAGRLLPEGCSLRSDFRIRWFIATPDGGERVDEWGADSLQRVRELLEERPANALRYTVTFCEHWTSQYVPVDPKALERPDTEGGVDGD